MGRKGENFDEVSSEYKLIERPSKVTPFGKLVEEVILTNITGKAVEVGPEFYPRSRPYAMLGKKLRKQGLGLRSTSLPHGNRALWAASKVRPKLTKQRRQEEERTLSHSGPQPPKMMECLGEDTNAK